MQYPIKYIENNLVWNHDGECFAYYELIPYNYSFLSVEQKEAVHDAFRQLIAQNRDGTVSFFKGSLLMASKPGEEYRTDAKDAHAVAAYPTGRWAFAPVLTKRMLGGKLSLPDNERTVVGQFTAHPYSHSSPPFALRIVCRNAVNWECDEHGRPALPAQTKFAEESSERVFVPYGCTATGMTHFPVCH